MKIFELKPIHKPNDDPWEPWYDKAFGFIIRAETEEEARKYAHEEAGDENRGEFMNEEIAKTSEPWLDANYSTCVELSNNGKSGVILKDFCRA